MELLLVAATKDVEVQEWDLDTAEYIWVVDMAKNVVIGETIMHTEYDRTAYTYWLRGVQMVCCHLGITVDTTEVVVHIDDPSDKEQMLEALRNEV